MQLTMTFLRRFVFASATLAFVFTGATASAKAKDEDKLVANAETTISNFDSDPQMPWLQKHLGEAKAVLIAPEVLKAGFILGGSGGRAVLVAHDAKTGQWAGPAFYTLATASVGFQAGIQVSETVALVMTDKALKGLLASSLKIGGDISVAAGPVGAGAAQEITADIVTFSRSKGLYGGLNLDGTIVNTSTKDNAHYYNKKGVLPTDILISGTTSSERGEKLRAALAAAVK